MDIKPEKLKRESMSPQLEELDKFESIFSQGPSPPPKNTHHHSKLSDDAGIVETKLKRELRHDTQVSRPSSSHTSIPQGDTVAVPNRNEPVYRRKLQSIFYPPPPIAYIIPLPQRLYQEEQSYSGAILTFEPYGYPVSWVNKYKKAMDLQSPDECAFPDEKIGQKLSWRFLFDGFPPFYEQLNALCSKKTQPTIERIVVQTVEALKRFKKKQPNFTHQLDRLVILEIRPVSSASVQATIGVMVDADRAVGIEQG